MKAFITTSEVAALLEISPGTLREKREELAVETGCPDPVPMSKRPLRWNRERVEAWLASQGLPRPAQEELPPRPSGPNVVLMEEARRA